MVRRIDERSGTEELETRSKQLFDESVGELNGPTRSALTQARHAALAEISDQKRAAWRIWGPLSGFAAAAFVVVVMLAPLRGTMDTVESQAMAFEDLDIVADAENLELLENLDFYVWLASADAPLNDG